MLRHAASDVRRCANGAIDARFCTRERRTTLEPQLERLRVITLTRVAPPARRTRALRG
jgi:hypothetical protein